MPKQESELRILLLQVRDDPRVRQQEHETFARYSGLEKSQIEIWNVFEKPGFPPSIVSGFDALFVGGASEASVLDSARNPFLECGMKLLRHCAEKDVPVFASCFGFQLAVLAFGGKIIRDEKDFEMGTIPIALTESAKTDPLLSDTPNGFLAVSVHRERALTAPPDCHVLAFTEACCHSFRVEGKRFWAFQFHPEVNKETLIERLTLYSKKYTESDDHLRQVLSKISHTPESNKLPRKFVERILLVQ